MASASVGNASRIANLSVFPSWTRDSRGNGNSGTAADESHANSGAVGASGFLGSNGALEGLLPEGAIPGLGATGVGAACCGALMTPLHADVNAVSAINAARAVRATLGVMPPRPPSLQSFGVS